MENNKLKEKINQDTEFFKNLLEEMDSMGMIDERIVNNGTPFSNETEWESLLKFRKNLNEEGALLFMQ